MELINKLPLGIVKGDEWITEFELEPLTNAVFKVIHDRGFLRAHPMKWTASVLSGIIKSIGGESVAANYRMSNYETIPDIVKSIPLVDCSYLLVCAHINEFGAVLEEVPVVCTRCEAEFVTSIDLEKQLEVTYADEPIKEVVVELTDGFYRPTKGDMSPTGIEGIHWKKYILKIPCVGDALKNESYYKSDNQGSFEERVLASAGIIPYDEQGNAMPETNRSVIGWRLISELRPRDQRLVNRAYTSIPQLSLTPTIQCVRCRRDTLVAVTPDLLFPKI